MIGFGDFKPPKSEHFYFKHTKKSKNNKSRKKKLETSEKLNKNKIKNQIRKTQIEQKILNQQKVNIFTSNKQRKGN